MNVSVSDTEATRTQVRQAAVLAPGTLLADRYKIVRLLGVGGMGMVYQADDQRLGLKVAIKVLRADHEDDQVLQGRFRQEVLAGRQISHQGVVRIHDLERDGELSFLTMDYVPGVSLSELLKKEGPLPLDRTLVILCQLAAALAAAHREGVVHRDLKPANVLLDAHGDAHISDFGIARTLSDAGLTQTGDVLGTPEYLAPEQAQGQQVDHRADIYSLGLILFRTLTGESASTGDHLGERLAQRLAGNHRRLSDTGVEAPEYLEGVLARCLARNPVDRYQSADELLADLEARRPPPKRPRRLSGSRAIWIGSLLVLVMALAAVSLRAPQMATWLRTATTDLATTDSQTAHEARHAVAILPLSPPEESSPSPWSWLHSTLPDMLTSSLSESPDLRLVDSVQVERTLEDLRLPPGSLPEPELRLLAELLDVDRLVLGRLWTVDDSVHAELRLVDAKKPQTPALILQGDASGEDVQQLPGRLAEMLRKQLEAQPPVQEEQDSASPSALVAYVNGLQSLSQGDSLGALPELEQAVQEEPTFTAAWVSLARTYQSLGQRQKALDAARNAVKQSEAPLGRQGFEARAQLASLSGEPEQAQDLLEELVEQYPHDIEARIMLAEAHGEAGEYDRADEILAAVTEEVPNHPRAWYIRGKYAILTGDSQRAADELLVRALVIQNRLGNEQGRADVLNALGAAHEKLGELDRAEERYREAVEIRQEIEDDRGAWASLSNLAAIQQLRGRYAEARVTLEEALALSRKLGYREGLAEIENDFGIMEEHQGHYRVALTHFRNALAIRRELGDQSAVAESHGNIGFAYFILGEYENAGLHWQKALDLYRQVEHHVGEALTLQSQAQLAMVQGSWEDSLATNLQVLELGRQLEWPEVQMVATAHLGRVAQFRGRYGAALAAYGEALKLLDSSEDLSGRIEVTLFQADALAQIGLPSDAMQKLEAADPWIEEVGHCEHRAERWRLEAEIARERGQLSQARELLGQAREEAISTGARVLQLQVDLSLGRLELAAGRPEQATPILRSVLETAERLGHAVLLAEAGEALAKSKRAAGQTAQAEEAVRKALEVTYTRHPMAIAARLHLLLAEILEARGASREADEQIEQARAEVSRLRAGLDPSQLAAFNRLPEVRKIERRSPA